MSAVVRSMETASDGLRSRAIMLDRTDDFEGWRAAARRLLRERIAPEYVSWSATGETGDLFADARGDGSSEVGRVDMSRGRGTPPGGDRRNAVPRRFVEIAERVVCHRDPGRFALLYRVLWRLSTGSRSLLDDRADVDIARLHELEKSVRRDCHKMRAFVRFRRRDIETDIGRRSHYVAWFEPDHHILRYNSDFFRRRFTAMHWSIVTPEESVHWNGERLQFGPSVARDALPHDEPMEALWRTYFSSIFNPARLRIDAMRAEMPMKYWKNLPEARLIAPLIASAGPRSQRMIEAEGSRAPRFAVRAEAPRTDRARRAREPEDSDAFQRVEDVSIDHLLSTIPTLDALASTIGACERCEVACRATQAVPGTGSSAGGMMLVGEQPGDREDLRGRPFVGPAGQLLREVLESLEVDPESCWLTNAVKHFDYEVRGKRRLHRKPSASTIERCRPFLFREIELLAPRTVVALGATAARALLGRPVRIASERGRWLPGPRASRLLITAHPSSVLRERNADARSLARNRLREDLALAFSATAGIESDVGC